jgi:hypothetical protein
LLCRVYGAPHFLIPNINRAIADPIQFFGTMDGELSLKFTLTETTGIINTGWLPRMPFAWVSSTLTLMACTMFFLLIWKYNALQFISMDALFDNPYDLLNTEYYDQFASAEFYAPSYVQMEVIDTLTQKYVNYYRQMHMNQNPTPSKHNGERRS